MKISLTLNAGRFKAVLLAATVLWSCSGRLSAGEFIIKEGKGNAEIVVAPDRARMVSLAALELQYYLEKISGARLPVVSEPGERHLVTIYVGRSEYTDRLGVTGKDLQHGAFRMVSGEDWLVLLGNDFDFVPPEPWPFSRIESAEAEKKWNERTAELAGSSWGYPWRSGFKGLWNQTGPMYRRYGEEYKKCWKIHEQSGGGFWISDEGGSLNAVYEFLRTLGVRWYMPGEIGEFIPGRETISLPALDRMIHPDFAVRSWTWYNYSGFSLEDVLWGRQLGMNSGHEVLGNMGYAHGLVHVHRRTEMKRAHPEYYALIGGERDTSHRGYGTACYSSQGLMNEAIAYARFLFDHYDQPHVSLWPTDGFRKCGCELCRDKSPSELVWGFVDRVARELYRTHPGRRVSCGAYTPYTHPPGTIKRFTPNVVVFVSNRARPLLDDPERWNAYQEQVEGWEALVADGNIMRVENNRYSLWGGTGKPVLFPVIHPRAMARDLRYLKGVSMGECCEESQSKMQWYAIGMDHLNLYVQSRYLWDAGRDINELLEEYYTLFYGPARDEMKAAIEFAEAKYSRTDRSRSRGRTDPRNAKMADRIRLVELLHTARKAAGNTVFGERIQLLIDELPPLEQLRQERKEQSLKGDLRQQAPLAVGCDTESVCEPETYYLKGMVTGNEPDVETLFTVTWDRNHLVFDILCREPDMKNLFVAQDIWSGDNVALLLEPPGHAYYQIEIGPEGKVFDADRGSGVMERWISQAGVKTEHGTDYWRVKIRLPVVGEEDGAMDPNHFVVGPKPEAKTPWYFNVGRARVRNGKMITYGFSPTGKPSYHDQDRFARLEIK